jgi:hypothetical protein
LDETAGYIQNGILGGRDWQSAVRANRANRSTVAGQPYSDRAVGVHNGIEDNLMDLAQRQGPAGTAENLAAANTLHGQVETLTRALDNGPTQQADELFTPARLDAASRAGANAFGGRRQSIMGNRPFYDLTQAGRAVMGNVLPDSGTATRSLVANGVMGTLGTGALGAGAGAPFGASGEAGATGAGLAAALTLMGTRGGQRLMTAALLNRYGPVRAAGQNLIQSAPVAGRLGAGLGSAVLTPLLVGQ